MSIQFHKLLREARFLDPTLGFVESKRVSQIRFDPLTGRTCRVLEGTKRAPPKVDIRALVEASLQMGCPFCSGRVGETTPQFSPDIVPEPRIQVGKALLVPNAFPYDAHSAVCILGDQHYVAIADFGIDVLTNGLTACQKYVRYVTASDPVSRYASINWNYMPTAGASLVHPHLQVFLSEVPTNHYAAVLTSSRDYEDKNGVNYWEDLIADEKIAGQRYLGATGSVHWLLAFAPRGFFEVLAVFPETATITELSAGELTAFGDGLKRLLRYLGDQSFHSFNLTMLAGVDSADGMRVQVSIVPRTLLSGTVGTSEVNYFQMLHCEQVTRMKPEDVCLELQPYFT